jgi:hypothetical protein
MRKLTPDEQELLDSRKRGFEAFHEERMPVLVHFMELLALPEPGLVLDRIPFKCSGIRSSESGFGIRVRGIVVRLGRRGSRVLRQCVGTVNVRAI